jgi:phospholipid transport system transporter-binding protein
VTRLDGTRLVLDGEVTIDTVPDLLAAGSDILARGATVVDFGAVTAVDSSAVSLGLQWLRLARASGREVFFVNLPEAMAKLARLYGVSDLLSPPRS